MQTNERLRVGLLGLGHARTLAGIAPSIRQTELARRFVEDGLSVRQAERLAAKAPKRAAKKPKPAVQASRLHLMDVERDLREKLGRKVSLQGTDARGRIIIEYYSLDDLENLLDTLLKP